MKKRKSTIKDHLLSLNPENKEQHTKQTKEKNLHGWNIFKTELESSIIFPEDKIEQSSAKNFVDQKQTKIFGDKKFQNLEFQKIKTEINSFININNNKVSNINKINNKNNINNNKSNKIKCTNIKEYLNQRNEELSKSLSSEEIQEELTEIFPIKPKQKTPEAVKNIKNYKTLLELKKIFVAMRSIYNFLNKKEIEVYFEDIKLKVEKTLNRKVPEKEYRQFFYVFNSLISFAPESLIEENSVKEKLKIKFLNEKQNEIKIEIKRLLNCHLHVEIGERELKTGEVLVKEVEYEIKTETMKKVNNFYKVNNKINNKISEISEKENINTNIINSNNNTVNNSINNINNQKKLTIEERRKKLEERLKNNSTTKRKDFVNNFNNNKLQRIIFVFKMERKKVLSFEFLQSKIDFLQLEEIKKFKEFSVKEIEKKIFVELIE